MPEKIIVEIRETETKARDIRWAVYLRNESEENYIGYGYTASQALMVQSAAASALQFAGIPYTTRGQYETSAAETEGQS